MGRTTYSLLGKGKRSDTIIRLQRCSGNLFWCRLIGKVLDTEKSQNASIWMFEDIPECEHAEGKLIESETCLRAIIASKDKFFSIIAHDLKTCLIRSSISVIS